MRPFNSAFIAALGVFGASLATPSLAEMKVVTSIKPVHSLVAGVMAGVGEPELLIKENVSPHDFVMKPSQARAMQDADVIFWIGSGLETAFVKPVETIGEKAAAIELMEAEGVALLEPREFEDAGHDDHGHDDHDHAKEAKHDDHDHDHAKKADHDDHAHDDHDHGKKAEHSHDDHGHDEHAGHGHEGHDHGAHDPHIWLDPENAVAMVAAIEKTLSKADPDNASAYKKNSASLVEQLNALTTEVKGELASVKGAQFVGFHDIYQYFEQRFDVETLNVVTFSPEAGPGAEHVRELREIIEENGKTCLLREPQFPSAMIETVSEGLDVTTGEADPIGVDLTPGPQLYFDLVRNIAASVKACVSHQS